MKEVIELLKKKQLTIATMESATGGVIANCITDIDGVSEVFEFSAVTYSNEYKIKMGVDPKIIEKYSVYSMETAMEMSKNISLFANSDIGIGVTGKINRADSKNSYGKDDQIFMSIYLKKQERFYNIEVTAQKNKNRKENKEYIVTELIKKFKEILD